MRRIVFAVLIAASCRGTVERSGTGRVWLTSLGGHDTVRFELPVAGARCSDGRGWLISGASRGQGVLVWLRHGEGADTGSHPLLARGDTSTPRGAITALRFMEGDVAHGFALDDGTASVTQTSPFVTMKVAGHGVETVLARQRSAEVTLERVVLGPDTVPCRLGP